MSRLLRGLVGVSLLVFAVGFAFDGSASAQGVGFGVKGGVVFPDFSSDALDFDNRTGWQAGIFFGGNRRGIVGVQGEVNWLRKRTAPNDPNLPEVDVDYLQIPVLLPRTPRAFSSTVSSAPRSTSRSVSPTRGPSSSRMGSRGST